MQLVLEAYERSKKTYGYRRVKIWVEKEYGIRINHNTVLSLMRKLNIRSMARKRKPDLSYQKRLRQIHTYPNLLGQDFTANCPNEKWGTVMASVRSKKRYVYLSDNKGFFAGIILGHALSTTNSLIWFCRLVRWQNQKKFQTRKLFFRVTEVPISIHISDFQEAKQVVEDYIFFST